MVNPNHKLTQCRKRALRRFSRSNLYYQPVGESHENLHFMEVIDKQFWETPCAGRVSWRAATINAGGT